ncbi:MAG: MBL fold metallo-hydrolase [Gammaproteobacteria bacterium]|nr:MBL fold metallo-hydrolase [Gammaproteobacteria bacterium]
MKSLFEKWLILVFITSLGTSVVAAAENFSMSEITDHVFHVQGPTGNTLVAVDNDGLILVDGVPAEFALEYLGFVREETGIDSIKTLVLSHWHPKVTGLNSVLGPQGVEIVAHENTRQWLSSTIRQRGETILHTPMPEQQLPNRTFYWGTIELPFRDDIIEVGYLLQSHTDGDVYVLIRDANVLYTGPAIRTDSWATVDETTNGFIGGVTDAYDSLGQMINADTVIVPVAGTLLSERGFDEQAAMYKALKEEMVAMLRQSLSPEEVVIANPAEGLRPEWGDSSEFLDEGFRSFYGHLRNGRQIGGGFP